MSYVICAHLVARPGAEQSVVDAMAAMLPISRAEDGCLDYQAMRSADDPSRFMFFERWRDEDAWRRHSETDAFRHWVQDVMLSAVEHRERHVYVEAAG